MALEKLAEKYNLKRPEVKTVEGKIDGYYVNITDDNVVKKYYLTSVSSYRTNIISDIYNSLNILLEKNKRQAEIACYNSSKEAFDKAREEKSDDELLFCTGSLYLIGEILEGNR